MIPSIKQAKYRHYKDKMICYLVYLNRRREFLLNPIQHQPHSELQKEEPETSTLCSKIFFIFKNPYLKMFLLSIIMEISFDQF